MNMHNNTEQRSRRETIAKPFGIAAAALLGGIVLVNAAQDGREQTLRLENGITCKGSMPVSVNPGETLEAIAARSAEQVGLNVADAADFKTAYVYRNSQNGAITSEGNELVIADGVSSINGFTACTKN